MADDYPLAASTVTGTALDKLTPKDFMALASARQQYVEKSLGLIDFPKNNQHCLGYPDGGLKIIYLDDQASPYHNNLSQRKNTDSVHARLSQPHFWKV